jgi:hypothetical protein
MAVSLEPLVTRAKSVVIGHADPLEAAPVGRGSDGIDFAMPVVREDGMDVQCAGALIGVRACAAQYSTRE